MKLSLPSSKTRQYIYTVITVAAPLLVVYGVVTTELLPLWIALAATLLGTGTAGIATKSQRANGTLPD